MGKLKKTYLSGILCILLAVWIIIEASGISTRMVSNEPGPRLFPYIAAAGIIICSILSMVFDAPKENNEKAYLDKDGWKRLGVIVLELVLFALGMEFVGFLPTGLIMTLVFILTLKREKKVNPIAVAVLVIGLSCLVYFGFTKGFHIPLPTGRLWSALGITLPF